MQLKSNSGESTRCQNIHVRLHKHGGGSFFTDGNARHYISNVVSSSVAKTRRKANKMQSFRTSTTNAQIDNNGTIVLSCSSNIFDTLGIYIILALFGSIMLCLGQWKKSGENLPGNLVSQRLSRFLMKTLAK